MCQSRPRSLAGYTNPPITKVQSEKSISPQIPGEMCKFCLGSQVGLKFHSRSRVGSNHSTEDPTGVINISQNSRWDEKILPGIPGGTCKSCQESRVEYANPVENSRWELNPA